MKYYQPTAVTISALNAGGWDANLIVPAANLITVDHVNPTTAAHGIVLGNGNMQVWALAMGG